MITPESMAKEIEELVWKLDISYIDAVIMISEKEDIEVEVIASYLSTNQTIIEEIRKEAESLNYIESENRLEM